MLREAALLWRELEDESGASLLDLVGITNHGAGDWPDGGIFFYLSDDDVVDPYDLGVQSGSTGPIRAGETVHLAFTDMYVQVERSRFSGRRFLAWANFQHAQPMQLFSASASAQSAPSVSFDTSAPPTPSGVAPPATGAPAPASAALPPGQAPK